MSDGMIWSAVAIALLVSVVRRRSVAIMLVTLQTLVIAAGALQAADDTSAGFIVAALVLALKGLLVGAVLLLAVSRTREPRAVRVRTPPLRRLSATAAASLAVVWLVPPFGLHSQAAEHAAVALVATGLVTAVLQPTTLFQVIGLLVAENGLALAAAHAVGGLPAVIELGAAFDLVLVVVVATVFHDRIFEEFGSADTVLLRGLRD
jgi:hydrogenase-4 component E